MVSDRLLKRIGGNVKYEVSPIKDTENANSRTLRYGRRVQATADVRLKREIIEKSSRSPGECSTPAEANGVGNVEQRARRSSHMVRDIYLFKVICF